MSDDGDLLRALGSAIDRHEEHVRSCDRSSSLHDQCYSRDQYRTYRQAMKAVREFRSWGLGAI